jgi:anti-sigma factor ChrR (cupin superfamily)
MTTTETPHTLDVTPLRDDWRLRCVVSSNDASWVSPCSPQVRQLLLERCDGEAAPTTSIMRYEPGASFSAPPLALGEEILVLDGILSDETGNYGAGVYIRNPPGFRHASFTEQGCTIFVKWSEGDQMDSQRIVVDTRTADWRPGLVEGLKVFPLHSFGTQHTALVRWAPQTYFNPHRHYGGEEILVLEGVFSDEHGDYPAGTWLRSPHLSQHEPFSQSGCLILVKVGHLLTT